MKFIDKMERKFGRYAIRNLPMIMVILYVIGYILEFTAPTVLSYLTLEPYFIFHGQIWRIISWVLIPPSSFDFFTVIMLLFYFSLGRTLEKTWGTFRYNFYIFSGLIFTVIGALILYGVMIGMGYTPVVRGTFAYMLRGESGYIIGNWFSTYYINMSIFLAFALTYPDMQVLLYFIIPIRMKYMGIFYGIILVYDFVQYPWPGKVAILASLLNFLIFFLTTRNFGRYSPKERKRRNDFKKATSQTARSGAATRSSAGSRSAGAGSQGTGAAGKKAKPLHRCTVCGRTELDDPNLEFRYCSKCYGDHEYCQDHLFNHKHITKPGTDYDPQ